MLRLTMSLVLSTILGACATTNTRPPETAAETTKMAGPTETTHEDVLLAAERGHPWWPEQAVEQRNDLIFGAANAAGYHRMQIDSRIADADSIIYFLCPVDGDGLKIAVTCELEPIKYGNGARFPRSWQGIGDLTNTDVLYALRTHAPCRMVGEVKEGCPRLQAGYPADE